MHALHIERATNGTVREAITGLRTGYLNRNKPAEAKPPLHTRLRMALDVALAVQHAHARGVRHCDLSCRNFLLSEDDSGHRVKIGDWGGAMMEGHAKFGTSGTYEEMQYELPCRGRKLGKTPVLPRDLFALGSGVYEIMAWHRPWQGLSDQEVEDKYARDEFDTLQDVGSNRVAAAIRDCWYETVASADDIVRVLGEELSKALAIEGQKGQTQTDLVRDEHHAEDVS